MLGDKSSCSVMLAAVFIPFHTGDAHPHWEYIANIFQKGTLVTCVSISVIATKADFSSCGGLTFGHSSAFLCSCAHIVWEMSRGLPGSAAHWMVKSSNEIYIGIGKQITTASSNNSNDIAKTEAKTPDPIGRLGRAPNQWQDTESTGTGKCEKPDTVAQNNSGLLCLWVIS